MRKEPHGSGILITVDEVQRDCAELETLTQASQHFLTEGKPCCPTGGPSALADIAQRMGVQSNYASKYKKRLIEAGVVGDVGQGHYTVELPGFKEYVREALT